MPTLADKGSFSFDKHAKITAEQKMWTENDRAIDIIIKVLNEKYKLKGKNARLYYLRGRTGSGKSTLMISSLFEKVIKGRNGALWCTEPRVVLTRANPTDVVRYNPQYKFGEVMGILSGQEKIKCSQRECMYYCTPQIFNDELLKIMKAGLSGADVKPMLNKIKLVVIDEVHVLDNPMMQLLKTVRDCVNKYGDLDECPLFMFASATIDLEQMVKYFHEDDGEWKISDGKSINAAIDNVYADPLMIGDVAGSSNFPVDEQFLTPEELEKYNADESENVKKNRLQGFRIMAEHFVKHYYPDLDQSDAFVKTPIGQIRCRDVLFFVPLAAGIEEIGHVLSEQIKDRPVMLIRKGMEFAEVEQWRKRLSGKRRVLFVPFARDYSKASDELLANPLEKDADSLVNEIRIVAATPVIETGKTIVTLRLCIDMGLNTTTICNPLSFDPNNSIGYLKQIPANVNQTIQRMGRVGREAPGRYLHFYSRDIYKKFQLADTAETINSQCLSNMMMAHISGHPLNTTFDIINENKWLFPTTIDVLVRTATDLIHSGFLTPYGQYVELRCSSKYANSWTMYARMISVKYNLPLFDALLTGAINWKSLPGIFNLESVKPENLRFKTKDILCKYYGKPIESDQNHKQNGKPNNGRPDNRPNRHFTELSETDVAYDKWINKDFSMRNLSGGGDIGNDNFVGSDKFFDMLVELPVEISDGICKAKNTLVEIMYGRPTEVSWCYNENFIY